jgi:signal transduction histidine kinase
MQRKEYLGRTNRELGHPPELCDLWEITYRRTFETQEPQEIEFTFESAEGPRNLSMSVVPELSEDGSVETIMGITRDITERKRSETALREINQELNEYAYAITHNLKAPIRAIYNYANFLLEDLASTLEGDPKKYLEGIKDGIALNNKQFEDLETLYRIKNHPLNFEPFELRELLDEMQSMFKNTSDRELIIAQNWPVLSGGRFFMRQILVGLINNGFKFNRADIKRVEAGWQTAAGNRTEIFVRDNGIGIDPQNQQEIFNIFRRLHTQSEYDGTGIGLAVVKRAVEKVGGRLRVESTVGGGSTFYISLPNSILENNHM